MAFWSLSSFFRFAVIPVARNLWVPSLVLASLPSLGYTSTRWWGETPKPVSFGLMNAI